MRRTAPDESTERDYENRSQQGTILLGVGVPFTLVGLGLLAGAIARYSSVSSGGRASTGPTMALGSGRPGRSIGWTYRTRF